MTTACQLCPNLPVVIIPSPCQSMRSQMHGAFLPILAQVIKFYRLAENLQQASPSCRYKHFSQHLKIATAHDATS